MSNAKKKLTDKLPVRFSELPTFRLDMLASITGKHGELLYERLFGLRTVECRVLGVVQAYEPVSLRRTCIEIGIDKSQGSRMVAKLVDAGLLQRRDDPIDKRSFYLLLTRAGRELRDRVNLAANERNQLWMAGLSDELGSVFLHCIELQIEHARLMLEEEARLASHEPPPAPSHEMASISAPQDSPLLVQRESLQEIYRKLGEVLAGSR